jgi:colanic acid biosynthesis glycosyl transferase WcaI
VLGGDCLPSAFVFYHYLPPDDVVSAVHFGELCSELVVQGWDVTAFPCNRACRDESIRYFGRQEWKDVKIERVWRPGFKQSSATGRLLNAAWMIARWCLLALDPRSNPDVLIVGTDPVLSVSVALFWRLFKPRTKIVHWCFDLYPEAAIADGILTPTSAIARILTAFLARAYAACDLIVDIGPCMRDRLKKYNIPSHPVTLVPWALEEPREAAPINSGDRVAMYGNASLALMYSGTFGKAHAFDDILALARLMKRDHVQVALSVRGNRESELRQSVEPTDDNVSFLPFAPPEELAARIASADIHIVSLREEWTGTVVPSKFFGAIAVGRPVLFCGSPESSIARWIREYEIGWVIPPGGSISQAADDLRDLSMNREKLDEMFRHCHEAYAANFSRHTITRKWNSLLRDLISAEHNSRR